jgi:hypothetical protein
MIKLRASLLFLIGLAACSEDEALTQVHPKISVCPRADAPEAECDRPLELGDLAITIPHDRTIYVFNRGAGPLRISELKGPDGVVTSSATVPLVIAGGDQSPLPIRVAPTALGPGTTKLEITSNDTERSPLSVEIRFNGTPKPVPRIELCRMGMTRECGTTLMIDFGSVRRTQAASETITVRNAGDAVLSIASVRTIGRSTTDGELEIVTSTRGGDLPPTASAPLVIVYEPADGLPDMVEFVVSSNDPAAPEARVQAVGTSPDNAPPIAQATYASTGSTSVSVTVGDVVAIDGRASRDAEGDPLAFSWSIQVPAGSSATLDDPSAGLVTFTPDRSGQYRVELAVTDSLGQRSALDAVVLVNASYRFAVRTSIEWSAGGDVDLHLVPTGAMLFSSQDTYFERPSADLGMPRDESDDPQLLNDSTTSPGAEDIVIAAPAPGTYRVYAHYFDDAGAGSAQITARVLFDDSGVPAYQDTQTLTASCDLWYIGDVVIPDRVFMPAGGGLLQLCR